MGLVTVVDRAVSVEQLLSRKLEVSSERITLRELIRQRIREEVDEYNREQSDIFFGLIQPTDTERVLNGYRLKAKRLLSWENQYVKALQGFEKNGFFVIVDGEQIEDLDQFIALREASKVRFLKLVPLVGG